MKAAFLLSIAVLAATLAAPARAASPPVVDAEHYLDTIVDRRVSPRDDFFRFAVGQWLDDHPIPPSERSFGIAKVVQDETYRRLVDISEAAAARSAGAAAGGSEQKIGDFWHAAMDADAVARQGMRPLAEAFARIDAIASRDALAAEVGRLQRMGVDAMGSLFIAQDEKDSERYAVHLHQGGLGLPNRDYYVDDDAKSVALRRAYVGHVGRMFELLGDAPARGAARAASVMALETGLARASRTLEALRDPQANYHVVATKALPKLAPALAWRAWFDGVGLPPQASVIVGQPEFFARLDAALRERPLAAWKSYLRWQLAHAYAAQAGGAFDAENFHFYGTVLNGVVEQRPRWKRMLDEQEAYLGDALGQLYVQAWFPAAARARYEKLTDEIFAAFRARIAGLAWMSEPTRQRALVKLDAVVKKVGYPDRWKDYAGYRVTRDSFLDNVIRGRVWKTEHEIAKLGKPVDRQEWEMTPQTYNAYYNPANNEIVLPAAAFALPGIADADVDDALVYGYVGGTTIGHEITHGFDDTGRQFDEKGNLASWWSERDEAEFKRRAQVVVRQYSAYVAVGDQHVNGEATQGENIADLGGIVLGWDAFTQTKQYREGRALGGFTPAQRYYIGWALGWMNQERPEALAVQVKTDEHAPSFLRVIGPVTNQTRFYEAFGVKPGDRMYRDAAVRASIW